MVEMIVVELMLFWWVFGEITNAKVIKWGMLEEVDKLAEVERGNGLKINDILVMSNDD